MEALNRRRRQSGYTCNWLRPLIRIWGVITAIVTCGVGADITVHGYNAGIFILLGSFLVLFFEIKWVVTLFVQLLLASDHYSVCAKCWDSLKFFGGWRLAPFYVAFGVALIFWPHNLWLSYVAGVQMLFLAILRLCTIFRYNGGINGEKLLTKHGDAYEKSDFLSDAMDDAFPEICLTLEDEDAIEDN